MSTENLAPGKRIRLRRIRPTSDLGEPQEDVIQKNLQPMIQYTEKKKRAQEAYYEKNSNTIGVSPMTRTFKPPVRQRLGRKVPFNGTNTSMLPPKKRLFKVKSTLNNSINKRKISRKNIAQLRLDRIRERNYQALGSLQAPKHIKLRRIIPTTSNLRVQVANHNALGMKNLVNHVTTKRHQIILDPDIQRDIRQLRIVTPMNEMLPNFRVMVAATTLSTNARFGLMD